MDLNKKGLRDFYQIENLSATSVNLKEQKTIRDRINRRLQYDKFMLISLGERRHKNLL